MPPVLGYWKIRGLGQPIRLLLHYVGEDFEDKYYECGPGFPLALEYLEKLENFFQSGKAPDFKRDKWTNEKYTLSLPFPNAQVSCEASMASENRNERERMDIKLPYYIDGEVKITQSNAILRHIARKYNMCGQTEVEMVRVDMLADQAMDFRNGLVRLVYNPRFNELYEAYMKELPRKLKEFEDFLGDKKFFVCDVPTFPDFAMYELLEQHRIMDPKCLDNNKKLKSFLDRFENLEPIKRYMQSDKFLKGPINNKMAKFGGE